MREPPAFAAVPRPGHHGGVRPVRLRVKDDRNLAETLRTVGYRAYCSCGEPFPVAHEWLDAVADLTAHKADDA